MSQLLTKKIRQETGVRCEWGVLFHRPLAAHIWLEARLCEGGCVKTKAKHKGKFPAEKLVDYRAFLLEDGQISERIARLRTDVEAFARLFPMPGHEDH